jgi:hypothetical protein
MSVEMIPGAKISGVLPQRLLAEVGTGEFWKVILL